MRAVRAVTVGNLHGWGRTFTVSVVAEGNGGEEDESVLGEHSLLDLIVGDEAGLRF